MVAKSNDSLKNCFENVNIYLCTINKRFQEKSFITFNEIV